MNIYFSQFLKTSHYCFPELSDLGVSQLNEEIDTLRRKVPKPTVQNNPEMILRWPSLAKQVGSINGKQKVSIITPQEVDFLQNEYPSIDMPDKFVVDVLQKRHKRQAKTKLKTILIGKWKTSLQKED